MNPYTNPTTQGVGRARADTCAAPGLPIPSHTNARDGIALQYAHVTGLHDDYFTVDAGGGAFPVRRAVGCLLEPGLGDTVLVSAGGLCTMRSQTASNGMNDTQETPGGYILQVLEHTGDRHVLSTGGDLEVRGEGLRLVAHRDLDCVAAEGMHLVSDTLHLQARESSHQAEVLRVAAGEVQAHAGKANLVVRILDAAYDSVCERMKRQVVQVEETADVQVGRYRLVSRSLCAVKSMFLHLRGEGHTKVEGKQIHLH